MDNIVIATVKSWNIEQYQALVRRYEGEYTFHLITHPEELVYQSLKSMGPRYLFFPHWSWKIPEAIYTDFTCILFHMTDLPFGRGGSPLQNLIIQGVYKTKISAIQVVEELDAGDIYLQLPFDLSSGSAQENFDQIAKLIFEEMIPEILEQRPLPRPQEGKVTTFARRTPEQSDLTTLSLFTIDKVYDFVRMLDAEGYPKAFIRLDSLKIKFSEVEKQGDRLVGRFEVNIDG